MAEALRPLDANERADLYGLLAALLLDPEAGLVRALAALPRSGVPGDAFATAWDALLDAAQRRGDTVLDEFDTLFVAPGSPRLSPYQCLYRHGCPADQPLAQLRDALGALGLQRAPDTTELEDHLGALCDTMRVLITAGRPREVQQRFFDTQLADWSPRCLQDLAAAPGADFYRALAAFAQAFFELESGRPLSRCRSGRLL